MVEIIPVDTPSLGDRSYLAHDGEVALVVDPQRLSQRRPHAVGAERVGGGDRRAVVDVD